MVSSLPWAVLGVSHLGKSYLLVQELVSVSLETEQALNWFPWNWIEKLARRSLLKVNVDCVFPSYEDSVLGGGGEVGRATGSCFYFEAPKFVR